MTTVGEWVGGARPRTLGAAAAPVLVGTAAASLHRDIVWWRAAAALAVALALQVGVNYANDYSDGVRGTDADRRGPVRLTATGLASPRAVKRAAALSFAVAGVVGGLLSLAVDWRLLILGVAAVVAAVLYTGGPRPYGYSGWGEVVVLVFFGFVATAGSAYVQLERVPAEAWYGSLLVGLPAAAILLANNLRDAESDRGAGKRTVVVRVGTARGRVLYAAAITGAFAATAALGVSRPGALLGLAAAPLALGPWRALQSDDTPVLVGALVGTARLQLVLALLVALGLAATR